MSASTSVTFSKEPRLAVLWAYGYWDVLTEEVVIKITPEEPASPSVLFKAPFSGGTDMKFRLE